ncbi:hypothetical protein [Fibrella aquatilis]|uniref:Lipoprotein n=1 Tax=Fibrella aquatilis TaxID=2817059 RepID=A0A939G3V0_9BACT|nr:hypothetical protein [Fibrella aquatilis]MBO0929747.1 hypothetical protein [Fibrella aquatilis]
MKVNWLFLCLGLGLLACGNDTTSRTDTTAEATSVQATPANEAEDTDKNVLHQMPTSNQINEAYEAILDKADVKDPELMEVQVSFSKSISSSDRDDANLTVKMVSPQNKNKIVFYRYDFDKQQVREPVEVTLTTGIGSTEKFIDTYDGFKASLFRKSDILDFDKADDVYKDAIAKSAYGADKCYVDNLQFMYFPNGLHGRVAVQSTRSTSASKSFIVDKTGQTTLY